MNSICLRLIGITLMLALVFGCTTQMAVVSDEAHIRELQPLSNEKSDRPIEGVVYYLPAVMFDMAATWTLVSCGPVVMPNAEVKLSVQITERHLADLSRPYVIHYKNLDAPLKNTTLKVQLYPNGTLQSINGDIKDKASSALTSLLELAKSISAIIPTPMSTLVPQPKPHTPCNPEAVEYLKKRKTISLQIAKMKQEIVDISALKNLTDTEIKKLRELNQRIKIRNVALRAFSEKTSFSQSFQWMPPMFSGNETSKPFNMKSDGFLKLFQNDSKPDLSFIVTIKKSSESKSKIMDSKMNPGKHLIYRSPMPAILQIQDGKKSVVTMKHVQLPQAGFHVALPLINQGFDNKNLIAEFAENGALTRFDFITEAQSESLAQALAKTAKTAKEIIEERKGRELKQIQAKTNLLKAKADLIRAQHDLQALEDAGE